MNRRTFALSPSVKSALAALGLAGGLTLASGLLAAPARGWTAYLVNAFYFLSIALGALVVTALLYVTKAGWGVVVNRVT